MVSGWDGRRSSSSTYYPSGLLTPEQGRCFKAIGCLLLRGPQTCCVIGPWTPEEWSHFAVQWGHWKKRLVARKPIISLQQGAVGEKERYYIGGLQYCEQVRGRDWRNTKYKMKVSEKNWNEAVGLSELLLTWCYVTTEGFVRSSMNAAQFVSESLYSKYLLTQDWEVPQTFWFPSVYSQL